MNESDLAKLLTLADRVDPESGKPALSYSQLGRIFDVTEEAISGNLIRRGFSRLPKVQAYTPQENEKAFHLAMVLTNYQAERVDFGHNRGVEHPFIKIWTKAANPRFHRLLDVVFEDVGTPGANRRLPSYYLHESLDYLLDPLGFLEANPDFLTSRMAHSAMAFGLLGAKVSEGVRPMISLKKVCELSERERYTQILRGINTRFREFEYVIGKFGKPRQMGSSVHRDNGTLTLWVKSDYIPEMKIALLAEEGVRSLRFRKRLGQWDNLLELAEQSDEQLTEAIATNFLQDVKEIHERNALEAMMAQRWRADLAGSFQREFGEAI